MLRVHAYINTDLLTTLCAVGAVAHVVAYRQVTRRRISPTFTFRANNTKARVTLARFARSVVAGTNTWLKFPFASALPVRRRALEPFCMACTPSDEHIPTLRAYGYILLTVVVVVNR